MPQTALVIGATGLVGTQLVRQLLADERFSSVSVFVRRPTGVQHSKLQEHVISFEQPAGWTTLVKGDVLFSVLGTTLKQAGNKEAQYRIDYTYQYRFAEAAAKNGVAAYVLVSSAGASEKSLLFYTRMKGELDRDVQQLPFRSIRIIRPGMLDGNRRENRPGEKIGLAALKFLNRFGVLKSQRPVPVAVVARAMINAAMDESRGVKVYELGKVFEVAGDSIV